MSHVSTFKVLAIISYTLIVYYLSLVFLEDTDGSLNVELPGMMTIAEKESASSMKIMESLYAGIVRTSHIRAVTNQSFIDKILLGLLPEQTKLVRSKAKQEKKPTKEN